MKAQKNITIAGNPRRAPYGARFPSGLLAITLLAFAFTACGGAKGQLTITNIGSEYKDFFIAGIARDADGWEYFIFSTVKPSEDEDFSGAKPKGGSVTLDVYRMNEDYTLFTGDYTFSKFTGDMTIAERNLSVLVMNAESDQEATDGYEFTNIKAVKFTNGSARINFATDLEG